jgi:hypothetical protein
LKFFAAAVLIFEDFDHFLCGREQAKPPPKALGLS